ncbi:glycosyltransferase family 39 protein [Filomicrobium sp.]|uniref:ArnT family glycosyltransferase n=1 Tax=Filomicrobium sp. TaxID=2024831 RepID=UPI00258E62DB|nr:glycosyltransferase family 39 protein [Filomicrobium sp.]MCV0369175.1 glycosyltransferase family 39 protein [Filomicrobium sp.]
MSQIAGTSQNLQERAWLGAFAAALLALLVVRILALAVNGTDLFFDEAQYWYWSLEPAFGYYSKPPLIAWLIRLSTDSCGLSEFCIRLPSPFLHTATAVAVFWIGQQLYDFKVGVVAGLAYATLPGVSVSAGIISTDVPLLLFWALALGAFVRMVQGPGWWPALLFGLAFGLGLNAKYAMAWFIVCLAVYLVMTPARRDLLRDARLYVGLGLGVLMIVPNLVWNLDHKFATFSHTADNAKWGGALFHPDKAAEFFGAQFGVFGPILFAGLLIITWRACRQRLPDADRLLLAFSLPLIAIITLQAFLSRAHANWAAVAYVAACVLVVATMMRDAAWIWLKTSFGVHIAMVVVLVVGVAAAGRLAPPIGADPFARTLGWEEIAKATQAKLQEARERGQPFSTVITDDRPVTAELLYYMRNDPTPIRAWRGGGRPRDHFELMQPFTGSDGPVLLVSTVGERSSVIRSFETSVQLGQQDIPAGPAASRRVSFFALTGYIHE